MIKYPAGAELQSLRLAEEIQRTYGVLPGGALYEIPDAFIPQLVKLKI